MVSLVDIVPQKRTVHIAGGELELRGLGLRQIADLLLRFPSLRNLFTEGAPTLDINAILLFAPDAIGAIIAESAKEPEAAEAITDGMPVDDVAECLLAVRDLTMPSGPSPFFDRLEKLVGGAVRSGKAPDMISPPLPNGSSPQDTLSPT